MITILVVFALQSQGPATTASFGTSDATRFPASLDSGDGEVALTHLRASGELLHRFGAADRLRIVGGADVLHYDWSGAAAGLPADLRILRLEATYLQAFDVHWSGVAHVSGTFQAEDGAELADGGAYGFGAGALYRAGPEFAVGALLRVITRIEDRPYVFLQPHLEWRPSPAWSIRTEPREGLGLEGTRRLDDAGVWALQARAIYNERRFRLDGDAVRPDGIFEDARFTVAAGIRWQPAPGLGAAVWVGVDLRQQYTLEDKRGHGGAEFASEPGPLVGVQVSWEF
jgi:hypothetical protein